MTIDPCPFPLSLQGVSQTAWLKFKWGSCLIFHSLSSLETWNPVLHEVDRSLRVADWLVHGSQALRLRRQTLTILLTSPRKGMN